MKEPERVLVAGDVHGNSRWTHALIDAAVQRDCRVVLQLGDFGACWPGERGAFEDDLEEKLASCGIDLVFIDGNHENHHALRALLDRGRRPDGFVALRNHILWAPRGQRWRWQGISFGALGGAFSIDWRHRTPETSWWPDDEMPSVDDLATLGTEPVDVLVTHDAPTSLHLSGLRLPPDDQAHTSRVAAIVQSAIENTCPSLVLHGHWHRRHSRLVQVAGEAVRVEGLAADVQASGGSWGVLDLPGLDFSDGYSNFLDRRWEDIQGAVLDRAEVQTIPALYRRGILDSAIESGDVLALVDDDGNEIFPTFQFDSVALVRGISDVLAVARPEIVERWELARWLLTPRLGLDGMSPATWLRHRSDPSLVIESARVELTRSDRP